MPEGTASVVPDVTIEARPKWLRVSFAEEHELLGFPVTGGVRTRGRTVLWHEVTNAELGSEPDVRAFVARKLSAAGEPVVPTFLTSRSLARVHTRRVAHGDVSATAVATVGLGNALRVGDSPGECSFVGTINVLCRVSMPLTEAAMLELFAVVVEARTLAVYESEIHSRRSGARASGTGTDCVIVAAPRSGGEYEYAGKHTALGYVAGLAVREAVLEGAHTWKEAHAWR